MWYIYKYLMPGLGEALEVELPEKCHICDINHQDNKIYMWAVVNITSPLIKRKIITIGTGWEIDNPDCLQFLRTVHMPNGCVCHVLAVHDEPGTKIDETALNAHNSDSTLALNDGEGNAKDVA
jgi:hypothetical protein